MKMKACLICIVTIAIGVIIPFKATAQSVPALINYQGKLTDASGNPLPNGTYGVAIRLWNKKSSLEASNTLVWGQEYTVTVQNGLFNAILGSTVGIAITNAAVNDLSFAFNDAERYFGLTVTKGTNGLAIPGAAEIVPRQQVLSTPYSLKSEFATLSGNGVPIGSVISFAGAIPPPGWLLCDGSTVNRALYAKLFAVIGTNYGSGDGVTTFTLPDLRGRAAFGVGQGPGLTLRQLAETGGEETHKLTVAEMPSHTHQYIIPDPTYNGASSGTGKSTVYANTSPQGGDQPHNTMPPFLALNYIIKNE